MDEIGHSDSSNATIIVNGIKVTGLQPIGPMGHPGAGGCFVLMREGEGNSTITEFGRRGQHEIQFRVNAKGKLLEFSTIIVV